MLKKTNDNKEYKMKKSLVILLLAVVLILASCGSKAEVIEIEIMDGQKVEISTEGMTEEQIKALEDVASGDSDMMEGFRSGLFTPEEIKDMGLGAASGKLTQPDGERSVDYSGIAIEDLNLDGLSEEQISAVKDILNGELTVLEAVQSGVISKDEIKKIGLFEQMPQRNVDIEEPAD